MRIVFLCLVLLTLSTAPRVSAGADPFVQIVVSKGDTLITLAERYLDQASGWREIARLNRLRNPDRIYPGQALVVPARLLKGTPAECVVTYVRGTVEARVHAGDQWRGVALNERIPEGWILRTGDESEAEMTFENGDTLFLRHNTVMGITASRDKGELLTVRNFFLHLGRVIETIRRVTGKETRSEVRTPSATCAVRGTLFRASVDEGSATRVETLDGAVEVDAARRAVVVQAGEGTLVRKGEPPTEPRKLLPPPIVANRSEIYKRLPVRLEFDWVRGAAASRVLLTRDREGRTPVSEKVLGVEDAFTVLNVEDGLYYLRTWSIDEIGLEGAPSEPVEIKVRVNPLPPVISAPERGSEQTEKTITLQWLNVPDAASYYVQVAIEEHLGQIVEEKKDIREAQYHTGKLEQGRYYFRISSVAADGFQGEWSDTISVSIIPPPPAPVVSAPRSDEKGVTMHWQDLGEGITYRFQMAKDADFSAPIVDQRLERSEIRMPKPKEPGTYYVRTGAIDARGHEGSFSKPQSFEVKRSVPYGLYGAAGALILILILLL